MILVKEKMLGKDILMKFFDELYFEFGPNWSNSINFTSNSINRDQIWSIMLGIWSIFIKFDELYSEFDQLCFKKFHQDVLGSILINMTTPLHMQYIFKELFSKNKIFLTQRINISVECVNEQLYYSVLRPFWNSSSSRYPKNIK